MISMIAAMSNNRVIGVKNDLPWHLPADLKHFKETTTGNPVIMGEATYKSIGRLLPNRKNIILTRDPNYKVEGAFMANSFEQAFELAGEDAFIIGGGQIYKQGLEYADRIYITRVDVELDGDVFFPEFESDEWKLVSEEKHDKDSENEYDYNFQIYDRVR
ncbi:MAG: dihydrofolate reductase [bacterium]|nr:dihydrofolate reductase [bacterium]